MSAKAQTKPPTFHSEAEEAEWWARNQDFILKKMKEAAKAGKLGQGNVARLARARGGSSPTITIRLPESDLSRARLLAAKRGLRYQTYLKMLLHRALDQEEQRTN